MCFFCTGCGACERASFEAQGFGEGTKIHCLSCGLALEPGMDVCPSCGRPAPALPGTSVNTREES